MSLTTPLSRWQTKSLRFRYLTAGAVLAFVIVALFVYNSREREVAKYVVRPSHGSDPIPSTAGGSPSTGSRNNAGSRGSWEFVASRDADDHGLSEEQCRAAFPKLFFEIDRSVKGRKGKRISYKELNSRPVEDGMVRGVVHHGELYIIEFGKQTVTFTRAKATLHALHRALAAFPDRQSLPDIEFTFTTEDFSKGESPIWTYSKREGDGGVWLMPDFGYWSWPEVNVGPYKDIRQRIAAIDDGGTTASGKSASGLRFKDKKKQLFWRGNIVTNDELRSKLLQASDKKSWSNVHGINWGDPKDVEQNLIPMEDHCRYMFLAHLEGRSFSGRGKYLLNCRSVVVSHALIWREAHHAALESAGPEANYVEVDREFTDLDRKMRYLLDNPDVAERIANNAVRTLRDRYLTPAAESCYWRELVRRYASVCEFTPELYENGKDGKMVLRGVPFESWVLNAE